jgi:hypothetical protein
MNSLIKKTALSGILLGSLPLLNAAPALVLGDDASLFINSSAGLESHSNIARSPTDSRSDTVLVLTPGIEIKIGGEGSSVSQLKLGYEIRQHFEEDDLNGEFARLSFANLYDTGVLVLKSYAGYNQYGTNARDFDGGVDALTVAERSDLTAGIDGKYAISEQMALGGGIDYVQRDWNDESLLTGFESVAIPVKLFFAVAPELDAFVGYRHRTVKPYDEPAMLEGLIPSYTDSYFFAGIEGEVINPLWTVALDVGFQERDYDGDFNASSDGLTFTARVNYAADVNRNYYAILARDFGTSTNSAVSYERTRLTVGGDYRITEMWTSFFGITLARSDYDRNVLDLTKEGRREHIFMGRVGVNYTPNEYLTISGSYQYIDVNLDYAYLPNSTMENPGYDNSVLTLTASFRY